MKNEIRLIDNNFLALQINDDVLNYLRDEHNDELYDFEKFNRLKKEIPAWFLTLVQKNIFTVGEKTKKDNSIGTLKWCGTTHDENNYVKVNDYIIYNEKFDFWQVIDEVSYLKYYEQIDDSNNDVSSYKVSGIPVSIIVYLFFAGFSLLLVWLFFLTLVW